MWHALGVQAAKCVSFVFVSTCRGLYLDCKLASAMSCWFLSSYTDATTHMYINRKMNPWLRSFLTVGKNEEKLTQVFQYFLFIT